MESQLFSILITTHNRLRELQFTLKKLTNYFKNQGGIIIICDDGSTDGTSEFIRREFPNIKLLVNPVNKGLIYSRNLLMRQVQTPYAISLDDDANFLTDDPFKMIANHFKDNPRCAVIAFRIYWGEKIPLNIENYEEPVKVRGFVGCGHAWRMLDWKRIPDYPDWFVFHGEEEFAAYQLFKIDQEIHYIPAVLVHHRVSIKKRKGDEDYVLRLRRSLRSGWYLMFIFYPWQIIPMKLAYSIYIQIKLKILRGDFRALKALILAFCDLLKNLRRLLVERNTLNIEEFVEFNKISETKIYWKIKESSLK